MPAALPPHLAGMQRIGGSHLSAIGQGGSVLAHPTDSLVDIVGRLQAANAVLAEAVVAFDGIEARSQEMHDEVISSLEESRQYWTDYASREKQTVGDNAATMLESIDSLVGEVENAERILKDEDRSFASRRNRTDVGNRRASDTCPFSETDDYLTKMRRVTDRMRALVQEYAAAATSYPMSELALLFSKNRRRAYEELFDLVSTAYRIRDEAFATVPSVTQELWGDLDRESAGGIETATIETADLLASIEDTLKSDLLALNQDICNQLDSVLPFDCIDQLESAAGLLGDAMRAQVLPSDFPEAVVIGKVGLDIGRFASHDRISSIIRDRYAPFVTGDMLLAPALSLLSSGLRLLVFSDEHTDARLVQQTMHSVMYRLLSSIPPSRQHFLLFDPEYRGRGFEPFLGLLNTEPELMSDQVWTTQEQMRDRLSSLSQYIDTTTQTKLSHCDSVADHNATSPDTAAAMVCLCILDFPKHFDEAMLDTLRNIIRSGGICGVSVIVHFNVGMVTERHGHADEVMQSVVESMLVASQHDAGLVLSDGVVLIHAALPPQSQLTEYFQSYCAGLQQARKQGINLVDILDESCYFSRSSSDCISIPIGKADDGSVHDLRLGEGSSHHALIAGATGSGKSTLLHTIVMSCMLLYPPEEVNLYLMDFKSGTEFKVYDTTWLPHIKLLAIDAKQEFGESILEELLAEMGRRSQLFKNNDVQNLRDYRSRTGSAMPRIVVIADEFQVLYNEASNRKVALHCADMTDKLVLEGRSYGIHLILATQSIRSIDARLAIRSSTLEQMRVRIGLKCGERDAQALFADNSADALEKMRGEIGSAVYNPEYTEKPNECVRVAFCDSDTQRRLLSEVSKEFTMSATSKPRVFEGARTPSLETSTRDGRVYVSQQESLLKVWLGEPIRVDDPVCLGFDRKKRNNLLILGEREEMASRLISLYLISVLGSVRAYPPSDQAPSLYYVDGNSIAAGGNVDPFVQSVLDRFGNGVCVADSRCDVICIVNEVHSRYVERKQGQSESSGFITVVFSGVQWLDVLHAVLTKGRVDQFVPTADTTVAKQSDDMFGFLEDLTASLKDGTKQPEEDGHPYDKLAELLEFGYLCGINFVLWANDFVTVRDYLQEFLPRLNQRIVFAVSDNDADRLIDGASVSSLADNTVLYSDGVKNTFQFKPYEQPSKGWIERL